MTYEEFKDYITSKCLYDAIYEDQEGREIIVMTVLDAYSMASKLAQRTWVGLKPNEIKSCWLGYPSKNGYPPERIQYFYDAVESALKDKNT